jgi:hypothetical protein
MHSPSSDVLDRRWRVFWLAFCAAICALTIAAAVESRSSGHALSAASFALFGLVSYRSLPLPLTAPISVFLRGRPLEPRDQVLTVVALLLLFSGLVVRWTIG